MVGRGGNEVRCHDAVSALTHQFGTVIARASTAPVLDTPAAGDLATRRIAWLDASIAALSTVRVGDMAGAHGGSPTSPVRVVVSVGMRLVCFAAAGKRVVVLVDVQVEAATRERR